MRILIVTDDFPPVQFGGMAQHAWHIAHQLSQRHAVRVLVPRKYRADWGSVPFDICPSLSIRFPALDVIGILNNARDFNPDVIHVCNAALSYRPVSKRYPTVTRVVGNDFLRPWCGYALPLRSLLYRLPGESIKVYVKKLETSIRKSRAVMRLKQVDVVVANSEWTRKQLIAEGVPDSHIHLIVGGLDTTVFYPPLDKRHARNEVGLSDENMLILTAGNLVSYKNIDTTIRSFAKLPLNHPSLYYIIVGEGHLEPQLRQLATDLGVRNRVIIAGRKTQEELCRYYQAADIYVQVSQVESMGRTYMEAGACGIPVVAARIGGVPSVVKDGVNGLLVEDPLDEDAVAAAIDQLLGDEKLRQRLGSAGLRMAKERFSWERVATAFEDVLDSSTRH